MDDQIDLAELGARVREFRQRNGLSLREAAERSGANFNTISRVERGQMPDLLNFKRLAEWVGLDPALFFNPPRVRQESTVEAIRYLLRHDPNLTGDAAGKISGLVESLYANFASAPDARVAHIHVADTFTPGAATTVAGLLTAMQDRLIADPTLGVTPGW